jgi:hypothetical protein
MANRLPRPIVRNGVLVFAVFTLALPAAGHRSDPEAAKKPKPVIVEGTLVDTKCYSMNPALKADDHATPEDTIEACGSACAKLGIPTGVLDSKNALVILIAPSTELADQIGRRVRVKGPKVFGGAAIRAETIEVRNDDGTWKAIDFHVMM